MRTGAALGQPGGVRAIVPTGPCCWRATTIRVRRVGLRAGSWFPFWHSLGYPRVSTSVCIQCRIGRASPALPAEWGGLSFPLSTTPGPLTHRNTDLPTATIGRKAPAAPSAGRSWRSPARDAPNPNRPANRTYGASVLATNPSEPGHATDRHGVSRVTNSDCSQHPSRHASCHGDQGGPTKWHEPNPCDQGQANQDRA